MGRLVGCLVGHGTLQDRLVKEMRLEGISSIADANAWIDTFLDQYERKGGGG